MAPDKDEKVYTARLAEQAERYDEMVEAMTEIARMDLGLSQEERNLLSVAYKNVIGARRSSWRIVSSLETKEKEKNKDFCDPDTEQLTTKYKAQIEKELQKTCDNILELLEHHLIPSAVPSDKDEGPNNNEGNESYVFYYKMKGDYKRYLAEFTSGTVRKVAAEESLVAYKTACEKAKGTLQATHPIRLGLALNFSVFYYEILNVPDRACRLAKQAFDDAVTELDGLPEENYKDSTLIMQLLRDNLTLWTSDMEGQTEILQEKLVDDDLTVTDAVDCCDD